MRTLACFLVLVLAALPLAGCSTEITLSEGRRTGYVNVRPVDAAGDCVMGLSTEFLGPDGSIARGTNAFNCDFTTSGRPGVWTLTFTVPEGYSLAPDQQNPVNITVANNEIARTVVNLVRE